MDKARFKDRLYQYGLLMRMDKPIGTLLLLWPTLWALWIAGEGHPDARIVATFIIGAFLMRSAGCVINDFADRDIDPHVRRTMNRPLAAKKVSVKETLALFVVLCLAALGLVLTMNELTVLLAFPGAVLAATYPFMKRLTYLPQVHLGVAFGWAVPMAFAAQTGNVPPLAWLMLVA
ncbi:MAG TPA: UbiA family prenyltransferase, partial [Gammaproteobacteria bacterium]|nr:UbiA family prenyltransferase [Gammaproteobacteria bacterium]